jgi:hypothetical protein
VPCATQSGRQPAAAQVIRAVDSCIFPIDLESQSLEGCGSRTSQRPASAIRSQRAVRGVENDWGEAEDDYRERVSPSQRTVFSRRPGSATPSTVIS